MSEVNREEQAMIPYYAHEGEMSRMERANKRLWIIIIILIVVLLGTIAGGIIYESQFQDIVTTVEQEVDTGEGMAIVSGTGDAIYGENQADRNSADKN